MKNSLQSQVAINIPFNSLEILPGSLGSKYHIHSILNFRSRILPENFETLTLFSNVEKLLSRAEMPGLAAAVTLTWRRGFIGRDVFKFNCSEL